MQISIPTPDFSTVMLLVLVYRVEGPKSFFGFEIIPS